MSVLDYASERHNTKFQCCMIVYNMQYGVSLPEMNYPSAPCISVERSFSVYLVSVPKTTFTILLSPGAQYDYAII